ncbi:MAG: AbrB family transcriptional regulator, partial [Pseudomonadota bacterium]
MPSASASPQLMNATTTLRALVIGAVSGWLAWRVGLPLPWMLGPMIGTTIAALCGANIRPPMGLRPLVIPVIGVLLGAGFTPAMLDAVGGWLTTLALLVPFLIVAGGASFIVYRRIGTYEPTTAFFSAMPGGLNEMLIVGEEAGGDGKRIALAHATRILIVIACVALFFGLVLGIRANAGADTFVGFSDLTGLDYVLLTLSAVLGTIVARWLKLPAAPVMGPMLLSGLVHITGWVTVPPPSLVVIAAQIILGTTIGCRFVGSTLAEIGRDLWLGLLSSLAMIFVAVG